MIAQVPNRVLDTVRAELAVRTLNASFDGEFGATSTVDGEVDKPKCIKVRARRFHCIYKFDLIIGGQVVFEETGRANYRRGIVRLYPAKANYAWREAR